jgi:hypothetical protein
MSFASIAFLTLVIGAFSLFWVVLFVAWLLVEVRGERKVGEPTAVADPAEHLPEKAA